MATRSRAREKDTQISIYRALATDRIKTYSFRRVRGLDTRTLEQESARGDGLALAFAEGSHELLELGGPLDLEEHLVVVIGDLDVEVLCVGGRLGGSSAGWASVLVIRRHVGMNVCRLLRSGVA